MPILFIRLPVVGGERILRLGFPINPHIGEEHQDLPLNTLMIASNRVLVSISGSDYRRERWLQKIVRLARHHAVELYIVAPQYVLEDLSETIGYGMPIPLLQDQEVEEKYDIIASVRPVENRRTLLLTTKNAWDQALLRLLHSKNIWGVSAEVSPLLAEKKILYYEAGGFRMVTIEEFLEKYAERIVGLLQLEAGLRSLMLGQFYRFLYEATYGGEEDIMDSVLGFSIISLYMLYDL